MRKESGENSVGVNLDKLSGGFFIGFVSSGRSVEEYISYMRSSRNRIDTFYLMAAGSDNIAKGDLISQRACNQLGLREHSRDIGSDYSGGPTGLFTLVKSPIQEGRIIFPWLRFIGVTITHYP